MAELLNDQLAKQSKQPTKYIVQKSVVYLFVMLIGGYFLHVHFAAENAQLTHQRIFIHILMSMVIASISELFDWLKKRRKGEEYVNPIWYEWWSNAFFLWFVVAIFFLMSNSIAGDLSRL